MEAETAVRYLLAVALNDITAHWIAADQRMIDETGQTVSESTVS